MQLHVTAKNNIQNSIPLPVVVDAVAAAEEDHHLLAQVLTQAEHICNFM
jgi:hypothetical protein